MIRKLFATNHDEESASIAEESGVIYEEPIPQDDQADVLRNDPRRESFIRLIALVTACFLGIGSHYAPHVIGPLKQYIKDELGLSNVGFGALQGSLSLLTTFTPLIGGIFTDSAGPRVSAVVAAAIVTIGQLIVAIGGSFKLFYIILLGFSFFG